MTATTTPRAWIVWMPGLVLLLILLVLFRGTATDMVHIWIRSETFQHAFLVPPIVAWLIWRRRDDLASVPLQPVPWLLAPMVGACFVWLLGDLADVAAASQFAMVALCVMAVPALFGWALGRLLAFPLLFLFFMVPFGEFAVPYLQEWTADVTVLALRLTGIPVYREGMQFVIPSGTWSVVEACSGIRYIIACFMVGTLFAYLNYASWRRRWVFVIVSLLVPVVANWIRAYTIVMIGHVTGSPMILGVEHTTYGWFLFGAVVMVMFWAGMHWSDDVPAPSADPRRVEMAPGSDQRVDNRWVVIGIVALLLATHAWAWRLQHGEPLPPPDVALPATLGAWTEIPTSKGLDWTPGFLNPSSTSTRSYSDGSTSLQVWVGYFRQQSAERKLVTSMHRLVAPDDHGWRGQSTGLRVQTPGLPAFATGLVSPGNSPSLTSSVRHRVWHLYWLEGRWLIRPSEVKLRLAFSRLLGQGDDGAIVMLSAPMRDDTDATLEKFARGHLQDIEMALDRTRESRADRSH